MCSTGTRACVSCGLDKSEEDFPWADKKRGFRRRSCKPCYSEIRRSTRKRYDGMDPEVAKAKHREYHQANRDQRNASRKQRYAELDPVERHRRRSVQKYGITIEVYNEMLRRQDERCAICRREETRTREGTMRALCVDHDHDTGAVRGLLCASCNSALGYLADDTDRLAAAIDYLEAAAAAAQEATNQEVI